MDDLSIEALVAALFANAGESHEILIVTAFIIALTGALAFFANRPAIGDKTLASIIVSLGFALANMAFAPVAYFGSDVMAALYAGLSLPVVPRAFWEPLPWWALIPIGLVIYDFAGYWAHRFLHLPLFWPIHAIHHSDPDVNGFTTYRVHIFEPLFVMITYLLILSWMGFPKEAMGVGALLIQLHNAYVHVNVDWSHGPLRHVIAGPRFHRWHHADTPELYGKNLANIFPFWDVLFGTYKVPGACRERMGAQGVPENDFIALMLFPLSEWRAMLERRAAKARSARAQATPAE